MRNLLVVTLSGVRYGLWEDAVASVVGARPLHRLPLSPAVIAGIAVLDGRSATIADLAACLGLPVMTRPEGGSILTVDPGEKIAGFAVKGTIDRLPCAPEQVLSLPDAVRTPVADSCAVLESGVVPIINILNLHARLTQGVLDLPSPEWNPPAAAIDLSRVPAVRLFSIGGERFCVSAAGTSYASVPDKGIVRLPQPSRRIAGVIFREGSVVPVMRIEESLGVKDDAGRQGLLFVDINGSPCGFLVDGDLGIIEEKGFRLRELPALVRLSWLPAAAVAGSHAFPLIDIALLLSGKDGEAGERPVQERFTPASGFAGLFRKSEEEIVEFSLLGVRHAVPREEVKGVHPLLPVSRIPHAPGIILGVAELQGELLPVLDLAAVFGRRSAIGKKWRMMRIANGDFHALVVTGEVTGDRKLPVETQKQVPIALPHRVLYGCYLDANAVRLILNVEALTVHFEKAEVRELMTSLSPEISEQQEETREAPERERQAVQATERDEKAGEAPELRSELHGAIAKPVQPAAEMVMPASARDTAAEEGKAREEERLKTAEEAAARKLAEQRIEAEKQRIEEQSRARAAEQTRLKAEASAIEEKRRREDAERTQIEEAARIRAEAEANMREREAERKSAAEKAARAAEEEARKREEEAAKRRAEELAIAEAAESARREAEEADRRAQGEAAEKRGAEPAIPLGPQVPTEQAHEEQQPVKRKKGRHIGIATVIALILVLVIYLVSIPEKRVPPEASKPVTEASKPITKEALPSVPKSEPRQEKMPPLYLTVPPDKAAPEETIYTVVKGDTLWGISKRFTGNPFNYPRVARDNSIATPDLIFPGQKIRLIQEKR